MSDRDEKLRDIVRPALGERVDSELEFHVELRTRELVANGMHPDDARREALARFGDIRGVSSLLVKIGRQTESIVERARFVREATQDAGVAVRLLMRRRGFAALAIGTLALGIGAATAIYSVVDGVLLKPLPFPHPEQIVAVWVTQPSLAKDLILSIYADRTPLSHEDYLAIRRNAPLLQNVALYSKSDVMLTTDAGVERIPAMEATASLLPMLQVQPALGRAFAADENVLNGAAVTMLAWDTWQSRFGGDSAVLGRRITLNDKSFEIIGVLPAGLQIDRAADAPALWIPALRDSSDRAALHNRGYRMLARVASGVPLESAAAQAARAIRTTDAETIGARVEVWQRDQTSAARGPLLILLGASGLLLLIACVNVAILQLAEAAARAKEMATRVALGAGVARLVRQLLVESIVIALVGAVAGTVLAWFMIRGLVTIAPGRLPGMDAVSLNGRVLAFTILSATTTGLLFGIVPAIISGRTGGVEFVRAGSGLSGRGAPRVQRALVAIQLALSMVLLVDGALLSRSLRNLSHVDPGFRSAGLTALRVSLPRRYPDEQTRVLTREMLRRLRSYPGIESAAATTHVPFLSGGNSSPITLDPAGDFTGTERRSVQQRYVGPEFFQIMGIRLLAGRLFNADDRQGADPVAIVSAAEVTRDFGTASPLGRRVRHQGTWRQIVGVVSDVKYRGLSREDESTLYAPYDQYLDSPPVFLVRGPAGATIATAVRTMLHDLEPRAALTTVASVPVVIAKSYAAERYRTVLVSAFAAMAALLAAIGLYGVSMRTAKRRMREFGIRLALGGGSAMVMRLLLSDAMAGVAIGLAVGTPVALLAARIVEPYLFQISARDPVVIVAVGVTLAIATVVAAAIPAKKAGTLDPALVLRSE